MVCYAKILRNMELWLIGKSRLDWLRKDCNIILMGKPWETRGTTVYGGCTGKGGG